MIYGGAMSHQRAYSESYTEEELKVTPRHTGEAGLPYIRFDVDTHYSDSNTDTINYRLEAGYGPIAGNFRKTHLWEDVDGKQDTLRIEQLLFLYRMSFGSVVEIDIGVGSYQLRGNFEGEESENYTDNGSAFSLPIIVHPSDTFGIEFRPVWSSQGVSDHELAILVGQDHVKFRAGYRWIEMNDVRLNGPFIGFSAHF